MKKQTEFILNHTKIINAVENWNAGFLLNVFTGGKKLKMAGKGATCPYVGSVGAA